MPAGGPFVSNLCTIGAHPLEDTYHNADDDKLHGSNDKEQEAQDLPADLALEFAAAHDDQERDEGGEVEDDAKGGEEAGRAPHRAEVALLALALVFSGKRAAWRIVEVRAAPVQADVLGERAVVVGGDGIGDPVRNGDGCDRHRRR